MNLRPDINDVTPRHRETAEAILQALGGATNITTLGHCVTRLRIELADPACVDEAALRNHPAVLGVLWRDTLQIVTGPAAVTPLATALGQLKTATAPPEPMSANVLTVLAPLSGTVLSMEQVPDPVFAQGLVGPGWAILPEPLQQTVIAPISGRLQILTPHAFVVEGDRGRAVLVHLGVNAPSGHEATTVALADVGQHVTATQPILNWLSQPGAGLNNACLVVAVEATPDALTQLAEGDITTAQHMFHWRATVQ